MAIYRVLESRTGKLRYRMFLRQAVRFLAILLAVQAVCAAGLFLLDRSALPDGDKLFNAVWNAANAITTLGDFTALSRGQKVFMMAAMFSLIAVGGYAITTLTGMLTSPDVISFRENRRVARMLADLKDHIIIVGFSRVGQLLAERIAKEGARVVVIDRSTDAAADASNRGYLVVQGAANEEQTLQRAGVARARAMLLTTDDTSHRLSVTLMARALSPKIYLLTIGLSEPGRNWLEHAGASEVVQVDRVVADSLHERLSRKIRLA